MSKPNSSFRFSGPYEKLSPPKGPDQQVDVAELQVLSPWTEEPPRWLFPSASRRGVRPPILRYGLPLDEASVRVLAKNEEGYVPLDNSVGQQILLFNIAVAIIEDRLGIVFNRRSVLHNGYRNVIELGNNIEPGRVSPEDIEKVKRFLGTDQEPMWFLDMCEYRWKWVH